MQFLSSHGPLLLYLGEALGLAAIVLALFRLRRVAGLTPLYVVLGVFQPIQVILASTVYVEIFPGVLASPSTLTFGASLLAIFLVYVREDAIEARMLIYGVLGANLTMTVLMWVVSRQLHADGTLNLLGVDSSLFSQGARVTAVGTIVLVADVLLLILLYTYAGRALPRHPVTRVWVALTGTLLFDALAFVTGAFVERPDYAGMLASGLASKAVVGTLFSLAAVAYLRFVEPGDAPTAMQAYPLRDVFYSLTYRDKFEAEAAQARMTHSRLVRRERELHQVFERITDAFVSLDADGIYTYVNPKAAQIIGRPVEDIVGRHVDEIIPHGGEALKAGLKQALATGQPIQIEDHYPDLDRWFESRIYPSGDALTVYFQDISERIRQRLELQRMAAFDELTGLPNRRTLRGRIDAMIAADPGAEVGVVMLNMDRLHQINDTLGYAAGDAVLVEVATRLASLAETHGCAVARVAGDEFALVHPASPLERLQVIAAQATATLAQPYEVAGESLHLTCSAGIGRASGAGGDGARLLGEGDLALNRAKQQGRNRVAVFSQEHRHAITQRVAVSARMRSALEQRRFEVHLQPLVDANTSAIVGAEALLRWHDEKLGSVAPADFIPIAEDTGFIVPLGDWVLREVLALQARWSREFGGTRPISVNVSAVQLRRPTFAMEVSEALRAAGVAPNWLKLEITESALMEDTPTVVSMLERLRELGVRISLDDFGTGYSSLAVLRTLPIDELKIDQAFVSGVAHDGYAATLCKAIITMSHQLRFDVVAEGVETQGQADFLRAAGCGTLQGYLFSAAVPAAAFRELLTAR